MVDLHAVQVNFLLNTLPLCICVAIALSMTDTSNDEGYVGKLLHSVQGVITLTLAVRYRLKDVTMSCRWSLEVDPSMRTAFQSLELHKD